MCSGRVDLEFIFRAFARGTDGVFVGGCRLGECNYVTHGNYHALNMVLLCKKILKHMGINPDRLMVSFMSSGEGNLFAEAANDFSSVVTPLGPLGFSEGLGRAELAARLEEVMRLIPYIKMAMQEKLNARVAEDQYDTYYSDEEIERLFSETPAYHIDPAKCQACMICARRCPVEAIAGGKGKVHVIDQDKCIKCGTCLEACPARFGAVQKMVGQTPPPPPARELAEVARIGG